MRLIENHKTKRLPYELIGKTGSICIGVVVLLIYFIRASFLEDLYLKSNAPLFQSLQYATMIGLVVTSIMAFGVRIRLPVFLLILLTGISTMFSEALELSVVRWTLWCLLLLSYGPLFVSPSFMWFRRMQWQIAMTGCVLVSISSFFWLIVGAPNYGRGLFTGTLRHSMLLGPVGGITAVWVLAKILNDRNAWLIPFFLCAVTCCVASGSRLALASMVAGILVCALISITASPALIIFVILAGASSLIIFEEEMNILTQTDQADMIYSHYYRKALTNTREELWESRLQEFGESPVTGIGFAGVTQSQEISTYIPVEPGSSYLSILSMTGLLGLLGFGVALFSYVSRLVRVYSTLGVSLKASIFGVSIFWAVHMAGEGYLCGSGSILSLLFWLWAGHSYDLLELNRPPHSIGQGLRSGNLTGGVRRPHA